MRVAGCLREYVPVADLLDVPQEQPGLFVDDGRALGAAAGKIGSDERKVHPLVLAAYAARRARKLDLNLAADAERLVVLGNLVVLWRVGIPVVFAVPLALLRDRAAEHQAHLNHQVDRRLVDRGQYARKREDDGVGQRIGLRSVIIRRGAEGLRLRLELDVNFEADDDFVRCGHRGLV